MTFTIWANSKIRKMSWGDIAFVKLSCVAFGIVLAILIPSLTGVDIWLMIAIAVILAIKPLYSVFK